jgi:hypothetical protein
MNAILYAVAAPAPAPVSPIQSLVSGLTSLLGLTVIDSILGISQTASLYLILVSSGSNHDAALASLSSDPAVLDLEPPRAARSNQRTRQGRAPSWVLDSLFTAFRTVAPDPMLSSYGIGKMPGDIFRVALDNWAGRTAASANLGDGCRNRQRAPHRTRSLLLLRP